LFRAKIVLLTVLISGSVLAGFSVYFLSVMQAVGLDRIDREILALGASQLHVLAPVRHWKHFDESLRFINDDSSHAQDMIVRITGSGDEVVFSSSAWPSEISASLFPEFDRTVEAEPQPNAVPEYPGMRFAPTRYPRDGFGDEFDAPDGFIPPGLGENDGPRRRFGPPDTVRETQGRIKKSFFRTVSTPVGSWRVGIMGNQRFTLLLCVNMEAYYRDEQRYRNSVLIAVPLGLLAMAGAGLVIVHRAMKPVTLIARTAERISARALEQRVPRVSADRELSRLVEVINGMLDRLQQGFTQAMRFSADAAHELQTPLTILQGELELAIQQAPKGSAEQLRCVVLLEEVRQLIAIVRKLLLLARADAGQLSLVREPVNLSSLVEASVEDAAADAPHLFIENRIEPDVVVAADPDLLKQAIRNLLSNAVKYNGEKGMIRSEVVSRDGAASITISNTGKPIPAVDRDRLFDRFYRADRARSKSVPGAGLGLSLAREIAHAHHGSLRLDDESGSLISFTMTLPLHSL
jgi:two-component system heavy metal sensor histidine kinase CusS